MSNQHSIIEHRANYFFIPLQDDYLAVCGRVNAEIEYMVMRTSSGPADCKGMILSVLEGWMNSKRQSAKSDDDLYVYFTYDEWEIQLRYRYMRSTIIRCLDEMVQEGQWLDEQGDMHVGLIKRKPHVQNTYAYVLNIQVLQGLLAQLPEQSPFAPRPRTPLGRPKKSRSKINGINSDGIKINGLKTDDITEIPSENTPINEEKPSENKRNNAKYRVKTNAPFYTQNSNTQITQNTDLKETQIEESAAVAATPRTPEKLEGVSPIVNPASRFKPARARNEEKTDDTSAIHDSAYRGIDHRDTLQRGPGLQQEATGDTHGVGSAKQPRTSAAGKRAESPSSAIVLSEQEQAFYDLYCSMPWIKIPPAINEKVKAECAQLAPHFKTQQDLYDLRKFMNTKDFFRGKFNLPIVVLAVNDWAMTQEAPVEDETMVNGKPRKIYSSFDRPDYSQEEFEKEFYPVKPIVTRQEADYAASF